MARLPALVSAYLLVRTVTKGRQSACGTRPFTCSRTDAGNVSHHHVSTRALQPTERARHHGALPVIRSHGQSSFRLGFTCT